MRKAAKEIVGRLQRAGFIAYFAGGCVRDQLLGREAKDFDVATNATPEEVQSLFPRTTGLEGKCFGVIRVLMDDAAFEVATFREDIDYQDGRRPNQVRYATAQEDAQRRDFTVNGLFYDPVAEKLIDFVEGAADLEKKTIRAIGQPRERFREDKLRLLRAIRFAVNLGFTIEENTWAALKEMAAEIKIISVERIREELDKIWAGPHPAHGLDLLDESGLLAVILPEIHALHGVDQPPQFHPEGDVFIHTRLMLSQIQNAPLPLALSILFHDVGKAPTKKVDETGRIRFNEHETVGARMTEKIMTRLRYSNDMIDKVYACVVNHMAFKDAPKMRLSKLKRLLGRETFDVELELHRIDCSSSHRDLSIFEFLKEQQATLPPDEIKPIPFITGHDLQKIGMGPGKELGKILEQVKEAQLEGKIKNQEEALELAKQLINSLQ